MNITNHNCKLTIDKTLQKQSTGHSLCISATYNQRGCKKVPLWIIKLQFPKTSKERKRWEIRWWYWVERGMIREIRRPTGTSYLNLWSKGEMWYLILIYITGSMGKLILDGDIYKIVTLLEYRITNLWYADDIVLLVGLKPGQHGDSIPFLPGQAANRNYLFCDW